MTEAIDHKTDPLFLVDDREANLPKWAQNLLATARRRVRNAEELAEKARLDTAPGDSTMLLDTWRRHDGKGPIGLGRRAQVTAVLGGRRHDDGGPIDYIDVSVEHEHGETIEVRGSGMLVIAPQAGNAVTIGVKRH